MVGKRSGVSQGSSPVLFGDGAPLPSQTKKTKNKKPCIQPRLSFSVGELSGRTAHSVPPSSSWNKWGGLTGHIHSPPKPKPACPGMACPCVRYLFPH